MVIYYFCLFLIFSSITEKLFRHVLTLQWELALGLVWLLEVSPFTVLFILKLAIYCTITHIIHQFIILTNHDRVPRRQDDLASGFKGTCPFHGDCIEGLVATGALAGRLNIPAADLPTVWTLYYYYFIY